MKILSQVIFVFFLFFSSLCAAEVSEWLNKEINVILDAYQDDSLNPNNRFDIIEKTVNDNFAGAGIAKFVAGKAWSNASKESKKKYIDIFKRHLALNIASMMQAYSNQKFTLTNTKYDKKNKVNLIEMEIQNNDDKLIVTWRVKQSKNNYYVIDLLVADISLVITKRSEFNSTLKKVDNDLNKFIDVLEKQNQISYSKLIN